MNTVKAILPAILAITAIGGSTLLTTGCAEVVERQEFDAHVEESRKETQKLAQKNDYHALVYDELVKRVNSLDQKMVQIDGLTKLMEGSLKRMEDQIRTLQAEIISRGTKETPPTNPAALPRTEMKLEDIRIEIETVLSQLRVGKIKTEEAATRLKIHAPHAAPVVLTEIKDSITKVDYTKQLEAILAKFPPAELKVPLQGAIGQRGLREAVARVIGAIGDRDLSKILEEHLADPDEDFRLAVGEALVRCRNGSGIPLLLGCLKSPEGATRTIAISALKRINRGEDLGYRPQLSPEQNAPAIKSWEEWSDKFAKSLFE